MSSNVVFYSEIFIFLCLTSCTNDEDGKTIRQTLKPALPLRLILLKYW